MQQIKQSSSWYCSFSIAIAIKPIDTEKWNQLTAEFIHLWLQFGIASIANECFINQTSLKMPHGR